MVYINGVNGKIGRYLSATLSQRVQVQRVTSTPSQLGDIYCDLKDPDISFCQKMTEEDFFLFFGAMATSRIGVENPELTYKINVEGTGKLIEAILAQNVRVVFCSSVSVYGPGDVKLFKEEDPINSTKAYILSKVKIEKRFEANDNFKIIRPSIVISGNVSFIRYLRYCANTNGMAVVYSGWYFNPISVQDLTEITYEIIKRWEEAPKVMNICGDEFISKEEMAQIYKKYVNQNLQYRIEEPPEEYLKEVELRNPCSNARLKKFYTKELMTMKEAIIAEQFLAR
jgi:nucleoside-diphosphate-sugar epimerase